MKPKVLIFLLLLLTIKITAQGIDISDYLKKIESGNIEEVKERLTVLKKTSSQGLILAWCLPYANRVLRSV